MKNNKKRSIGKKLFRNAVYGAIGLGFLAGAYKAVSYTIDKNVLNRQDFQNAEWIEFYNPDGKIWDNYMNENIPKNQSNWHLYMDQVRKKNSGNLEGRILLPDLDRDGTVHSH